MKVPAVSQDTEDTYDKFISLKYTYTWKEEKAREGYIVHDTHTDDVLIEAITTDSSQNGANSTFAIGDEKYDKFITVNDSVNAPVSAGGDDEGSTTMLSLLSSAFAVDTDETDDNSAYMLEPYIREDYGFAKTGFSAFKEKILDAVKFLTGSFATLPTQRIPKQKRMRTTTHRPGSRPVWKSRECRHSNQRRCFRPADNQGICSRSDFSRNRRDRICRNRDGNC